MCKYCNYDLPLHYLLNDAPLLEDEPNYPNVISDRNDTFESASESIFTEIQSLEVSATENVVSSFKIPDTSFNRKLKGDREYRGMLASGEALPGWIDLNSKTGRLTFEAGSEDIGDRQILIQIEDKLGQVASVLLDLVVASRGEETLLVNDEPDPGIAVNNGDFSEVQEVATVPQIAIADTQITDSSVSREVIFTITLNTPSDRQITVDYSTADDTATKDDYIAIDGAVTFEPGETEQTITVNTTGTSYLDPDEDFQVNLSNPRNATIEDSQGIGTILPAYAGIRGGSRQQETVTYSFFDEDVFGQGGYDGSSRESNAKEPSESIKANYRQIFKDLNTFVDREFVEVAESELEQGDIRIVISDGPDYAYAGGHIHLAGWAAASDAGTNGWESPQGVYAYSALMHELGHAIGMPHPFGRETSIFDPEENSANTVMSYTSPGAKAATFMSYDLKSLQERYGAAEYREGDTLYEFVTVDNYLVNGEIAIDTNRRLKQTIWDSGGTDTFDFSGLEIENSGYRFDLNQSKYQTTQSGYEGASYDRNGTTYYVPDYGTSIAIDVEIENLINSSSDDLIIANPTANTFSGYAPGLTTGDDLFIGTDELDTLDLSEFSNSNIAETIEEADLKYELGEGNFVTIKDYFNTPKNKRIKVLLKETDSGVKEDTSKPTNSIAQVIKASSDRPATTITSNDALPSISIQDAGVLSNISAINEEDKLKNSTGLLFEITLDSPSDRTVKVDYATEDGTAIANEDYSAKYKTLIFQPGETIKNVFIGVTLNETKQRLEPHVADEELYLTLSNAENATIVDARAVGTIEETRSLSVSDLEISEDATEALFTVSLDKPSVQGVFVSYATEEGTAKAGADYSKTEGRLFIKAGRSQGYCICTDNRQQDYRSR